MRMRTKKIIAFFVCQIFVILFAAIAGIVVATFATYESGIGIDWLFFGLMTLMFTVVIHVVTEFEAFKDY